MRDGLLVGILGSLIAVGVAIAIALIATLVHPTITYFSTQ